MIKIARTHRRSKIYSDSLGKGKGLFFVAFPVKRSTKLSSMVQKKLVYYLFDTLLGHLILYIAIYTHVKANWKSESVCVCVCYGERSNKHFKFTKFFFGQG